MYIKQVHSAAGSTFVERLSVVIGTIILSTLFVALTAQAVTTISTNVSTDGNLTVSGSSTFGDAADDVGLFTGTLQASTTALFTSGLTTYGNSVFGDAVTDENLFTGTLQASSTVLFDGATSTVLSTTNATSTTFGATTLSTTGDTDFARATTTSLAVTGDLDVVGTASTTNLKVRGGTTIAGIAHGYCAIASVAFTASTTKSVNCTSATGVEAGDRIFVQATTTQNGFFILAASSTAIDVIQVMMYNNGDSSPDTLDDMSLNFWAVR